MVLSEASAFGHLDGNLLGSAAPGSIVMWHLEAQNSSRFEGDEGNFMQKPLFSESKRILKGLKAVQNAAFQAVGPIGRRHEAQSLPSPILSREERPLRRLPGILDLIHQGPVPVGVEPAPAHDILHQLARVTRGPMRSCIGHQRVGAIEAELHLAVFRSCSTQGA